MKTLTPAQRHALAVMPLIGRAPHAYRGTAPRPHFTLAREYRRSIARQAFLRGVANNAAGLMADGRKWRPEYLNASRSAA